MTHYKEAEILQALEATHKIRTWLAGKSVLLVGGGDVDYSTYSEVGFDVVCRVNSHYWTKYQNGRIDMLVHNCTDEAKVEEAVKGIKEVKCLVANHKLKGSFNYLKELCKDTGVLFDSLNYSHAIEDKEDNWQAPWFATWVKHYNFRPLTGCLALEYLRNMPVTKIKVLGFDLYSSTATQRNDKNWIGPHNLLLHAAYLHNAESSDCRLEFSPELREAIVRAML